MRGMSGLSWLLPICSIGFFAFAGTAIYGAVALDWSAWLLAAIALPAIPLVWLGLMLALMDVTRRPPEHLSDEARMIWTGVIGVLNVFIFIPYWLIVIRGNPPIPEAPASTSTTAESNATEPGQQGT